MEDALTAGHVIAGKYRIERELGRGGMAVVFLAHHLKLGSPLALKVMLPQFKDDPEATARFSREARAMARLKSEHVVRVLDIDVTEDGRPYIAMEYIEGSDLAQVLHQRERLPFSEAATYVCQAALALSEAHAAGVVHRDLKPGNLILTSHRDGSHTVKVLDFGISKNLRTDLAQQITRQEISMGTPSYMSPEQLRASSEVGPPTDIWALGVILYQLVTGKLPFAGDNMPALCVAIMDQPIPLARDTAPDVPATFEAIIQRCLRRTPEERFENVEALREALLPFASAQTPSANATTAALSLLPAPSPETPGAHVTPLERPVYGSNDARRWTVVGAVAIGAFIGLGYWFGRSKEHISDTDVEVLKPTFGARSFPSQVVVPTSAAPSPHQNDATERETQTEDAGVETGVVDPTLTAAGPALRSHAAASLAGSAGAAKRPPALKQSPAPLTKAEATAAPTFTPPRNKRPAPQPPAANTLGGRL